jgi:hypothetical protein
VVSLLIAWPITQDLAQNGDSAPKQCLFLFIIFNFLPLFNWENLYLIREEGQRGEIKKKHRKMKLITLKVKILPSVSLSS